MKKGPIFTRRNFMMGYLFSLPALIVFLIVLGFCVVMFLRGRDR